MDARPSRRGSRAGSCRRSTAASSTSITRTTCRVAGRAVRSSRPCIRDRPRTSRPKSVPGFCAKEVAGPRSEQDQLGGRKGGGRARTADPPKAVVVTKTDRQTTLRPPMGNGGTGEEGRLCRIRRLSARRSRSPVDDHPGIRTRHISVSAPRPPFDSRDSPRVEKRAVGGLTGFSPGTALRSQRTEIGRECGRCDPESGERNPARERCVHRRRPGPDLRA